MKFLINVFVLIYRVFSISLFREQWAADEPAAEPVKNDIEPSFEYDELPGTGMTEAEKIEFAKENNLTYRPKEKKAEEKPVDEVIIKPAPKADEKVKDEENIVEIKADDELTLEKAQKLLEDYENDEEVEINGETLTKAEFLAKFEVADEGGKTYTVGKETLDQAQYTALLADYKKKNDLSDEDIKDIPAKALAKQLEIHNKLDNRSKALHQESQQAANMKRDLAKQADYVEGKLKEYEGSKKSLEAKEAELEKLIKRKPDEEFEDIYDEDERREKISDLKMDQKLAKDKLDAIKEQKETANNNIKTLEKRINDMAFHSTFIEINERIPELKLEEPAYKILTSKKPNDYVTAKIANIQMVLVKDFLNYITNNPESEWTVEDYYRVNEYRYSPGGPQIKSTEKNKPAKAGDTAKKKRLLRLIVDQKNTPFSVKPGSGSPVNHLTKEDEKVKKYMEEAGYANEGKYGIDVKQ